MEDIITGAILYLFLKTIGIPKEDQAEMNAKKEICDKCPLKVGNFCSKKFAQRITEKESKVIRVPKSILTLKVAGSFFYMGNIFQRGCGCFLPFKQLSGSHCPLKKW